MRVLVANMPFVKYDANGIRTGPNAGSRWPWTLPGYTDYAAFPFFMGYAVSYLQKNGVEADFYDGVALKRWDYELVKDDLRALKPELLVLETSTPLVRTILQIARWAKEQIGCRIVLVGPHLAAYHDDLLKESFVDHAVVGEYEKPLLDIALRGNDAKRLYVYEHVEDLNNLNGENWLPYRPLDYLYNYWDQSMFTARTQLQVNTSRGCPFKCTYCQWPKVMNNGVYRSRSAAAVLDEIRTVIRQVQEFLQRRMAFGGLAQEVSQLHARGEFAVAGALRRHAEGILPRQQRHLPCGDDSRGIQSIFFDDDTWNLGAKRITDLCKGLKEIGLPWTMMGRIDTTSNALYDQMVESGCVGMRFGIESFNQRLLDNTKKHLDARKSYENVKYLITRFRDMEFHFTTMKNLPGEVAADWENDQKILNELKSIAEKNNNRVHWQNSDCIAFPGTELWEEMVSLGKGDALRDFDLYDGNPVNNDRLSDAVGWLGSDYTAKWSKYSEMGDPKLLPKDTREMMQSPSGSQSQAKPDPQPEKRHPLPVLP